LALGKVKEKVTELNEGPGQLLPGVQVQNHFDLTGLLNVTRETVRENLMMGMVLVVVILLMFLSNVRSALIVAINIPLALLFAFSPLFAMRGPGGQIFGPMADTYAFALGGALILALTIAPVLRLLFFRNLKPVPDNFLVRFLKRGYLRNFERCLDHRWATLAVFAAITTVTVAAFPFLGREFMPEL